MTGWWFGAGVLGRWERVLAVLCGLGASEVEGGLVRGVFFGGGESWGPC